VKRLGLAFKFGFKFPVGDSVPVIFISMVVLVVFTGFLTMPDKLHVGGLVAIRQLHKENIQTCIQGFSVNVKSWHFVVLLFLDSRKEGGFGLIYAMVPLKWRKKWIILMVPPPPPHRIRKNNVAFQELFRQIPRFSKGIN
jgi:hypothetical protein